MSIPSDIFDTNKGRGVNSKNTACEIHRKLYDLVITGVWPQHPELAERMSDLLEDSFNMSLKISDKLREFGFDVSFAEGFLKNNDKKKVALTRNKRIEIVENIKTDSSLGS